MNDQNYKEKVDKLYYQMFLIRLGQTPQEKLEACEWFLAKNPSSPFAEKVVEHQSHIYLELAKRNERLKNKKLTEEYYAKFLKNPPLNGYKIYYTYMDIATFMEGQGKLNFAEESLKRSVYSSDSPEAFNALQKFYEKYYTLHNYLQFLREYSKNSKKAKEYIQKILKGESKDTW